jgi:hypothetical protein
MRPRSSSRAPRFEGFPLGGNTAQGKGHADLLLWQAEPYAHPRDVLADERLDVTGKRALLAAWASDACAVDSRPGFRWLPGTPGPMALERILAAIRCLDELPGRMTEARTSTELRA